MKKYLLSAIVAMALAAMLCVSMFAADISVGSANDLVAIMTDTSKWDDNITLTADIDLTGKNQAPIGNYTIPYSGTFDGAGFTIKGLNIVTDATVVEGDGVVATIDDIAVGLFGVVKNATIKNLTVEGLVENGFVAASAETKIEGLYSGTGAIVGVALTNCSFENLVNRAEVLGAGNTGGVIGHVYNFEDGTVNIIACENYGLVDSTVGNVAGVIGRIYTKSTTSATDSAFVATTVDACVNHAELSFTPADRLRGGGIVGYIRTEDGIVNVLNCRNNGSITATNEGQFSANIPYIGGIVGRNEIATSANAAISIKDCINVADITSSRITGGITSYISRGEASVNNPICISGCVNTGDINGSYFAAGIVTYAELNGIVNPPVMENCLNTGNITYDYFEGQEYANTGTNQEAAGGLVARNKGLSIKNCVSLGTVAFDDDFRVLTGALIGKMQDEMAIPCTIADNYYLYSKMPIGLSMVPSTGNTAVGSSDAANKDAFAALDFDSAWAMSDVCPMPAALVADSASVTIPEGIEVVEKDNPLIPDALEETTAPVTEEVVVTEPVVEEKDGIDVKIIIAIVAAVVAVVAVVVVIAKKKK